MSKITSLNAAVAASILGYDILRQRMKVMENQYKEYLLVDGYNIINAWPELNNEMKKVNLESARDKLIDIMADYSASMAISVVVVFDAHQVDKSRRTRYRINGVDVIYTKVGRQQITI